MLHQIQSRRSYLLVIYALIDGRDWAIWAQGIHFEHNREQYSVDQIYGANQNQQCEFRRSRILESKRRRRTTQEFQILLISQPLLYTFSVFVFRQNRIHPLLSRLLELHHLAIVLAARSDAGY